MMIPEQTLWLGATWMSWLVVQEVATSPKKDGHLSVSNLLIGAIVVGLASGLIVWHPLGFYCLGLALLVLMIQASKVGTGTSGERRRRLASIGATAFFMTITGVMAITGFNPSPWQGQDSEATRQIARWIMSANLLWLLGSPTNKLIQEIMLRTRVLTDSMEGHGKYTVKREQKNILAGQMIGFLERSIAAGLVVLGAYEAVGFLIAAKGLIRLRSLEKEDFAEYVLLGTLLSLFPAFAAGLAMKYLVLAH